MKYLLAILVLITLLFTNCKKDTTPTDKYCTTIVSANSGGLGWRLVFKDKLGNLMEINVTETDFNKYQNVGTTICLDNNYKIYR